MSAAVDNAAQPYVMLEHDARAATILTRHDDLSATTVVSDEAAIDLSEIGVRLPLATLYEKVEFPDQLDEG